MMRADRIRRAAFPSLIAALACVVLTSQGSVVLWGRQSRMVLDSDDTPLPSISSACIEGREECTIAVGGGSLKLSNILFPNGDDAPGSATASGYVDGKFVSGDVQLSMAPEDRDDWWTGQKGVDAKEEDTGGSSGGGSEKKVSGSSSLARQQKVEAAKTSLQVSSGGDSAENEQYKLALEAVEGHLLARQKKVEEEAKKIAEAVTRVITSPSITAKVATLAMEAAAAKQGLSAPQLSQVGGEPGGGGMGSNQYGFAMQPAGASRPTGESIRRQALRPWSSDEFPLSSKSYNDWKAGGTPVFVSQIGQARTSSVQQLHTVHRMRQRRMSVATGPVLKSIRGSAPNDPWVAFRNFQQSIAGGA